MAFKGYQRRAPEDMERRAAGGGGDFVGVIKPEFKTWTPSKGDNYIRFLPPTWEGAAHYGIDVYVHYGLGPNNGQALCLARNKNQRCPICDERNAGRGPAPEPGSKRDPLLPTRRVAVWILDMKEPDKGPMVWLMAQSLDQAITKICRDKETGEWYFIDDPRAGYNVNFEKEGEGRNTDYVGITLARRPSSVDAKHLDYVADHPLPTVLSYLTYEEIMAMYEGNVPAQETAPEPERRGRAPVSRQTEPPADDVPPPNGESDYGGGEEPGNEAPKTAAARPGVRPAVSSTRPAVNPAPAAETASAPSTASSLRDRLKNRPK